jgi:hypothetical protein
MQRSGHWRRPMPSSINGIMSASGRFCCKSLFALVIKISFGCTHDFRVKMWGTSLREDKLAGDLGNVIEATSIRGRRSDFFTAGKLAPGHLDFCNNICHNRTHALQQLAVYSITSSARASSVDGIVMPNVLAAFKLITRSILVICCTGRSAGFSPFKMRPA